MALVRYNYYSNYRGENQQLNGTKNLQIIGKTQKLAPQTAKLSVRNKIRLKASAIRLIFMAKSLKIVESKYFDTSNFKR